MAFVDPARRHRAKAAFSSADYDEEIDDIYRWLKRLSNGALRGQITFPATQNPSANANVLDDYEEGIWTPVLTCVTPGDLAVTYAADSQFGSYVKLGKLIYVTYFIVTTEMTETTASGSVQIAGLPFKSGPLLYHTGTLPQVQGVTVAGYSIFAPRIGPGVDYLDILAGGSGVNAVGVDISNITHGPANLMFIGSISYYPA